MFANGLIDNPAPGFGNIFKNWNGFIDGSAQTKLISNYLWLKVQSDTNYIFDYHSSTHHSISGNVF